MSHRKYEAPRHGSLAFLPRKRSNRQRGRIRHFPKDNRATRPHFTGFVGFKAGMTHVVRELNKPGSKMHKKEVLESVSILETPPMIVVGLVGYRNTVKGLRNIKTVWANHLSDDLLRNFYRKWQDSKKKAFSKYALRYVGNRARVNKDIEYIKSHADVVRAICHTQQHKLPMLERKKSHIIEIQINGGTVREKVSFALNFFEKELKINQVFAQNEVIDIMGVTKGKGFQGVTKRWGTARLPRKTHKGLRKVACIGAWHPARVSYAVARAGQMGCHHRVEMGKKIFRLGVAAKQLVDESLEGVVKEEAKELSKKEAAKAREAAKAKEKEEAEKKRAEGAAAAAPAAPAEKKMVLKMVDNRNAKTDYDLTTKPITPMGGFPHYGIVKNDFIMVKGSVIGPKKRALTLRKAMFPCAKRWALEEISLKFIDTSSKMGSGRWQTSEERKKYLGPMKPRRKAPAHRS
ncbi:ribosomal protein L3 [Pelomyxa schiedti]|nr:ribosomal protein L3 [Pelomyxa schiedti]